MRWIVALAALAAGIWYLRNRQRRDQLRDRWQEAAPPAVKEQVEKATAAARGAAEQVKETVAHSETVQQAVHDLTEKAHEVAKSVGDAAATVQQASGSAIERVQQAAQGAAGHTDGAVTDGAPATVEEDEGDTSTPSIRETVQSELANVGEAVKTIRDKAQATAETAEKSAGAAFGSGTIDGTEMKTVQAPATDDVTSAPSETQEGGIAPVGQRPRPIAGEGTTTATGGAVDALSPVSDGATSAGKAEPLPQGLTPGEPGTGGPAGSAQAPSTPDSTETPTTGMEQPPEIDRAAEVFERTSGEFIGNKNTRVFHAASSGNLPSEENRVYFESEEEAVAAGFRPAEREGLESAGS